MPQLSAGGLLKRVKIGNDAGWFLAFYKEKDGKVTGDPFIISRDDYYAEISAELPEGLDGGSYTFTIEGITDEHYGKIRPGEESDRPSVVRLYLFWRDTNASAVGYLANLAGITDLVGTKLDDSALVAELSITGAKLQKGARRYEAEIKARERVFQKLSKRITTPVTGKDPVEAVEKIAKEQGIEVETFPVSTSSDRSAAGGSPGSQKREEGGLTKGVDILRNLARRMEEASGNFGRGMLLLRDGKLYIGERKFPLAGGDPIDVTHSEGLIQVEAAGSVDLEVSNKADPSAKPPPKRKKYKLTLKGRPDLKPGDVIRFDLPPQEVTSTLGSKAGALGNLFAGPFLPRDMMENPTNLYVSGVSHKLGRKSGFVTVVTGVEIKDVSKPWDPAPPTSGISETTPEGRAVVAMQRQVKGLLEGRLPDEVAEVRAMNTTGTNEPPGQTLLLWRGLVASDGNANGSRRLAIQHPSRSPHSAAPYLTPFAWGKTGLVLPRYPGTRVLVSHRGGESDDAIDIGAMWQSGYGPESEPGDWWLILPIGVPANKRKSVTEDQTPDEHNGKVSQDLIDAEGNRVIEVGELTVRVGRNAMKDAGKRPERSDMDGAVTVEHADGGAKIIIKNDGTIIIEGKKIELTSSGDIEIKAANVKVGVSGSMDVGNP
jgi:hypothetical protein